MNPAAHERGEVVVSAHDVAAYIVSKLGHVSAMKLQKLVYYCQAWSLVWDDEQLFSEPVEAWANGPVVRDLYTQHRGQFSITSWPTGDASRLDQTQAETVESVLQYYGDMNAQMLSDLTHNEQPWKQARRGMAEGSRGRSEISCASMAEYYSSLSS